MTIEIEKGIPMPEMKPSIAALLRSMEIGDSAFFPRKDQISSLNPHTALPFKFRAKREFKDGIKGIRVWRVE